MKSFLGIVSVWCLLNFVSLFTASSVLELSSAEAMKSNSKGVQCGLLV